MFGEKGGIRSRATCALGARLRSATRFEFSRSTQKTKTASQKGYRLCLAEREGFALEFCEAVCANRSCMPRKILRSPLQTIHWMVCLTLRSNPSGKSKRSKNGIPNGMPFLLGGKGGIRTLGRVLADTRFPVVRLRPAQPPFRTQALTLYHAGNKKSTPFLRLFKKFFIFCQNALLQIRNFLTNPPGEHIIKHIINE